MVYTLNERNRQALPELPALIPLIQQARAQRAAHSTQHRGEWHKAELQLSPDGTCHIVADWMEAPEFHDGSKPTRAELDADLTRYPRGARWIAPWMRE